MCGIAGTARLDGGQLRPDAKAILKSMALALRPRGPDDMQFVEFGGVAMSFTRLSLIDPLGGRQPFVSSNHRVALAANGEIYNHEELRREFDDHTFRSRSDCEVLLHLYERDGLRFLDRVRGMFGIAVLDLKRNRIVLARDRIGLKPLFVHRNGPTLLFGSEVKALFQHPDCPRRLNWFGALADQGFNAAPVMPSGPPTDWFLGVNQIEPGTIVTYDLADGTCETTRYWSLPEPLRSEDVTPRELVQHTRDLLAESVRECLVADAEIGIMLSGGVDSAGIAALSRGVVEHSFTAVNASTVLNGDVDRACSTAATLGLLHHELAFPADTYPAPEEWRRLLWLMESPLCGPEQHFKSEIYRLMRSQRPDMKAMLLGSGADELGGGYTRMLAGGGDWHDFIANITDMSRRRALSRNGVAMGVWWQGDRRPVSDEAVRAMWPGTLGDVYDDFVRWKVRDWQQYNFWVEDRTASGNAVEARVPFLDHRIVETLASVPRKYREELFWDKRIIRSALADLLPAEIISRPKTAFYEGQGVRYTHVAFARMLTAHNCELLAQALATPHAAQYLRGDQIRACLADIVDGRTDTHLELLLGLVNLGLLDAMCHSPPNTHLSSEQVPVEIHGSLSQAARHELIFGRPQVDPDAVLALGDGVLVLTGRTESYVAMSGELRFVIDHEADGMWLRLLHGFDGRTRLGALCDKAGCDPASIRELVEQSLHLGLLTPARG